jgi:hypothetical protein
MTPLPRDVRSTPNSGHGRLAPECPLCANSGHCSAIARTLIGHRECERSEKGRGENRRKNICRCYGHVPNWLTDPNESQKERHD